MPNFIYILLVLIVAVLIYRSGILLKRSHIEIVRELEHSNGAGKFLALVVKFRKGTAQPLRNQSMLEGWLKENLCAFAPLFAHEGDRTAPDVVTIAESEDPSLPKGVSFQTMDVVNGELKKFRVEFIGSSPFLITTEVPTFEFGDDDHFLVVSTVLTNTRNLSSKTTAKATTG